MLAWIKAWLLGITAAALLVAAAQSLMPGGAVRRVGRLTGGLVLLLAALGPVLTLDQDALSRALSEYHLPVEEVEAFQNNSADVLQALIEEKAVAYISDKAEDLGIACSVAVETRAGEDGYPVPYQVTVAGELSQQQRQALTRRIEADFAIPAERQIYQKAEGVT